MKFPRLQIGLPHEPSSYLAIAALGTASALGDPVVKKQNDRTAQKIPIGTDKADVGAHPPTRLNRRARQTENLGLV